MRFKASEKYGVTSFVAYHFYYIFWAFLHVQRVVRSYSKRKFDDSCSNYVPIYSSISIQDFYLHRRSHPEKYACFHSTLADSTCNGTIAADGVIAAPLLRQSGIFNRPSTRSLPTIWHLKSACRIVAFAL